MSIQRVRSSPQKGILAGMAFIVEDAATRNVSQGYVVNMSFSVAPSASNDETQLLDISSSNEPTGYFLAVAAGNDDTDAFSNYGVSAKQ
ncbi:hypothetical protein CEK25_004968 [Fusarium fujikuroi]|nr:hypothetical protein CEK25_004968 [Fusarium fujikuroi]